MTKTINKNDSLTLKKKLFVDRDTARELFWEHYVDACLDEKKDAVQVLMYYGISGIGKSSLCDKLIGEIKGHEHDIKYVHLDFENVLCNEKDILCELKKRLICQYRFSFDLFEYALYSYEIKCGKTLEDPDVKTLVEQSPFLSVVLDDADAIPLFSPISAILRAADSTVAYLRRIKSLISERESIFEEIDGQSLNELKDNFLYYFICDMIKNLSGEELPMIILMDSYEKLVNELESKGNPLYNDLWLRGENGLILNCPHIIWVIFGRERLKWERVDPEWDEECLNQYELEVLLKKDADDFLKKSRVEEKCIRTQIIKSSMCVPYSLDLAVDTYHLMKEKGESISANTFKGNDVKLASRFLKYMNDEEKELLYLLSCMKNWTDAEMEELEMAHVFSICTVTYEKIISFSFVVSNIQESEYYIHNSMEDVLKRQCPARIKTRYICFLGGKMQDGIKNGACTPVYRYAKKALDNIEDVRSMEYMEQLDVCIDVMKLLVEKYEFEKYRDVYCRMQEVLAGKLITDYEIAMSMIHARYLMRYNKYKAAAEAYEEIMKNFGLSEEELITCYEEAAYCYGKICDDGKYTKTIEYAGKAIKMREKNREKYEKELPAAYNSLAYAYYSKGQYEDALRLYETARKLRVKYFGETYHRTIANSNNIAEIYYRMGKYTEAEELLKECIRILEKTQDIHFVYTLVCRINLLKCRMAKNDKAITLREIDDICGAIRGLLSYDNEYSTSLDEIKGDYYFMTGDYKNASIYYHDAYEKFKVIFGDNNIKTIEAEKKMRRLM